MNSIIIATAGTLFFIYLSRKSILNTSSHGFFRFFAFECLLFQFIGDINHPVQPHSSAVLRILTDVFFNTSLCLAAIGFWLLRKRGQPDSARNDSPMLEFEKTTKLVSDGIYGYIRHPMYGSLLLLSWGFFLKHLSPAMTGLSVMCTLFLFATARAEERENINYFGAPYRDYMNKTKRFIPFVL